MRKWLESNKVYLDAINALGSVAVGVLAVVITALVACGAFESRTPARIQLETHSIDSSAKTVRLSAYNMGDEDTQVVHAFSNDAFTLECPLGVQGNVRLYCELQVSEIAGELPRVPAHSSVMIEIGLETLCDHTVDKPSGLYSKSGSKVVFPPELASQLPDEGDKMKWLDTNCLLTRSSGFFGGLAVLNFADGEMVDVPPY